MHINRLVSILLLLLSLNCFATDSESNGIETKSLENNNIPPNYWTQSRMQSAKPYPMAVINKPNRILQTDNFEISQQNKFRDGKPPEQPVTEILDPTSSVKNSVPHPKKPTETFDKGTSTHNYSSSRLVPATANIYYPYSTVGKLFFTIPNKGDYYCSASVINYRVVVTAGHCVHDGSGSKNGFYTNFSFVPAYREGVAPFLAWRGNYVAVTAAWFHSNGVLPNSADYAMIEVKDRSSGVPRRLGSDTGFLGYQIDSTRFNHVHILGYPSHIDGGEQMHQVTAKNVGSVPPHIILYASDMRQGSDGGPFIQNFGQASAGQTGGLNPGRNRVVGIASFFYGDENFKIEISSNVDYRFENLFNKLCAHRVGNCA